MAPKALPVPSKHAFSDHSDSKLIENINGRVASVQFFLDDEIDPSRIPDFVDRCASSRPQSAFDRRSTRYIWFCTFVVPDGTFKNGSSNFTMALRRAADNSLVAWLPGFTVEFHPTAPFGMLLSGYGAKDPGQIEAGAYRLEIYTNSQLVGTGSFEVRNGLEQGSPSVIDNNTRKEKLATYEPSEIFLRSNEAVVLVRSYDESGHLIGFGSGFNIHEDGVIVTNLHVLLSGGNFLDIKFPKHGTYQEVYIRGFSNSTDLAVLRIDGKDLPKVKMSSSVSVNIGDRIYTISSPQGLVNTLSEGLVSAERFVDNTKFYQITAPISKGSSGGAVFNKMGEVIGVASSFIEEGQNLNFAIDIDELFKVEIFEKYFTVKDLMDSLKK